MSNIKQCFNSRWIGGYIMEADYSQLEIIALAELTQDKQLIQDIIDGVDLHRLRASELFRVPEGLVTPEQRTIAKMLSFQLQYGAGAASMASSLGIAKEIAVKFVKVYYKRYPRVKEWQDDMMREVISMRSSSAITTKTGTPAGRSIISSSTGRLYGFTEYDAPDWAAELTNFSPTEVKNYPVQGYATGDIVPFVLGYLRERLYNSSMAETSLLVNTVHDSIVLDIQKKDLYNISRLVKETMEYAPQILKKHFNIDSTLPFTVGVSFGQTWGEQVEYDFDCPF